ncbi:hypothetical protein Afil01_54990 [Actinorhabdospora filicis]|uniref:Uncharacterized protein n=1 Tax=Actinorhabdospora filicis TaxID=1785913 RepID=A0A9W6W5S1_9ACTN|nr:hypothetical protein [Actinorhabdospora filicis]GLZ80692.1 hypothetical protein Afil01_54990 [Actinorhabdospora filicis]
MDSDELRLPPDSPLAAAITAEWRLLPLRIPTGWTVQWNTLHVRRLPSGLIEVNDSEDLLWAERLPPSWLTGEKKAAHRKVGLDIGWYRDTFRAVILDPDWDSIAADITTTDLDELVATVEDWLPRY